MKIMIKKYILISLLFLTSLSASNKAFDDDVKKYLEKDFYKFGIAYDKQKSKISFIETEMLFENGKNSLRKPFEMIIDRFFPRYLELLVKHQINIKNVIVKGHTSSLNRSARSYKKKFYLNKILSQKRADSFLDYLLNMPNDYVQNNIEWIDNTFLAQGMSSSDLIYDENGVEDTEASRRVEIEIVFNKKLKYIRKSSNIIKEKYTDTKKLKTYVKRLLEESATLKEKLNLLKSFEADIKVAQAAFNPTVTLNAKYTDYSQSTPDNFTDTVSKDITLRYNLFNGYKDLQEKNIKTYNYQLNQHLNEQIEDDLVYSLVEAFNKKKKQKDTLELAKLNLEDYDLWIAKEDIKFQNGMISLRNYAKIQSRDTTQRMNYQEINKQYLDTISTFKRYLNFNKKDIEDFEDLYPNYQYINNKDIAYFDLKQYSPYVKEATQNIQLYNEKLLQSKVNFYPTVNVIAKKSILDENYETASTVTTKETSVAFEASLELYSGGKDSANYEKKLFEYREKMAKKEEVLRDVKYKLDLAFNRYDLTLQKEKLLKTLIKKREDSLLGASYDYKFAKIDANGLLDTIDDLYSAKKMYIENKYEKLLSQYKILNVIGVLKTTILETQNKDVN